MESNTKTCPVCGSANTATVMFCALCGAALEENPTKLVAVPENLPPKLQQAPEITEAAIDINLIPEDGVGVLVAGEAKPFYLYIYKELIIGRKAENTLEAVLDLSDLNAANLGVSRRHAVLRRTADGFAVLDLASRNGTWLNGERLLPNRAYPCANGARLRIGQMWLQVMYRPRSTQSA